MFPVSQLPQTIVIFLTTHNLYSYKHKLTTNVTSNWYRQANRLTIQEKKSAEPV